MIVRYLNPKNDIAFKRIFGREQNKDILIALLNSVLVKQIHKPIKEVTYLPRDQDPETARKKASIVDILCKDEDDCLYVIEMQVADNKNFKKRAQYYAAKAYISQSNKGGKYQDLKKVIFLAFMNYPLFPTAQEAKTDHQILCIKTHKQHLKDLVFTFVDLKKAEEINKDRPLNELTLAEKFYYFLRNAEDTNQEAFSQLIQNTPIIEKAYEELTTTNWTDQELAQYEESKKQAMDYENLLALREAEGMEKGIKKGKEEGRKEGMEKGMEKGIEKGMEKGRKAVLQSLLEKGILTKAQVDAELSKS